MSEEQNPFGITREDVINLCVNRLIDDHECTVLETITNMVRSKLDKVVAESIQQSVNTALAAEMERILSATITPVDMWGDPTGKPTTIRDSLCARAKTFFSESVDAKGNPTSYGGKPRYAWMFANLAQDEFSKAVRDNITTIAAQVKNSVRDTIWGDLQTALDNAFRVK